MKISKKEIIAVIFLAIFLALAFFTTRYYSDLVREATDKTGIWGALLYVAITVLAVVVAPISTLPLVIVAVSAWGNFIAAVLSIIGWTLGAVIAFILARVFGRPLVARLVNLERVRAIENKIPQKNFFWSVVFLRMVLPVDILSYGLGLFSNMKFLPYLTSTIIGVIPFAFIFSYSTKLPVFYQILVISFAFVIAALGFIKSQR